MKNLLAAFLITSAVGASAQALPLVKCFKTSSTLGRIHVGHREVVIDWNVNRITLDGQMTGDVDHLKESQQQTSFVSFLRRAGNDRTPTTIVINQDSLLMQTLWSSTNPTPAGKLQSYPLVNCPKK